jgi:hypothetical protein
MSFVNFQLESTATNPTSTLQPLNSPYIDPEISDQPKNTAGYRIEKTSNNDFDLEGSFLYDKNHNYPLEWDSWEEFKSWLRREEISKTVELRSKGGINNNGNGRWIKTHIYVCAWNGTGGKKNYQKKSSRVQKIASKRLEDGCPCRVVAKTYPGTSKVRGRYTSEHSHGVGNENVLYTRIPTEDKQEMAHLLSIGVSRKKVVRGVHTH